ncbi:MAG: ferrochelatase [Dissulfuribacterales bacterium]
MKEPFGVIFLNMGGPDSLEAVQPFLFNLFSDREIIHLGPTFLQPFIARFIAAKRAPKSAKNYALIGGKTPLTAITQAQAEAVQQELAKRNLTVPCMPGMRYWHPRTTDVLKELAGKGIRRVIGLSLYPHYSKATSGSSIGDFLESAMGLGIETTTIESFYAHSDYINALKQSMDAALQGIRSKFGGLPKDLTLLYSAHSLPVKFIQEGDPYLQHLEETIRCLEAKTNLSGILAFQSRSGPVKWLTPATDHMLMELGQKGIKNVLILPISFVSDHIETLYEIDIQYAELVKRFHMNIHRVPSLNTHPDFIRCLTDLILRQAQEVKWLE